jgi:hypothetical protein
VAAQVLLGRTDVLGQLILRDPQMSAQSLLGTVDRRQGNQLLGCGEVQCLQFFPDLTGKAGDAAQGKAKTFVHFNTSS